MLNITQELAAALLQVARQLLQSEKAAAAAFADQLNQELDALNARPVGVRQTKISAVSP